MTAEEARLVNTAWLIDRTGWTVEYIEAMDPTERLALLETWQAMDSAQNWHMGRRGGR